MSAFAALRGTRLWSAARQFDRSSGPACGGKRKAQCRHGAPLFYRKNEARELMSTPHISVCICTFRRAKLLTRLLDALEKQETGGQFTYSVIVADNDREESARPVVTHFLIEAKIAV